MKPEQAMMLLQALGTKPWIDGEWVKASCPLAPFTHKKGTDSNPSFGISLIPGEHPFFHCFSCRSGSLEELLGALDLYRQQNPAHNHRYNMPVAREILNNADFDIVPLPEYGEFSSTKQEFEEWPQWYIESFTPWFKIKAAFEYLKSRGITKDQATRFDLRYDTKREMIVHPYKNAWGKLAGARGRSIHNGKGMAGHYDYTWNEANNAALVWYNEEVLASGEPIVVVEGQWDLYAVDRVYPNVVANLTALPKYDKVQKLTHVPWVILFNDSDETGQTANAKYLKYLVEQGVKTTTIDYPDWKNEDGTPMKLDPDKMGSQWIEMQLGNLGLI